MCDSSNKTGVKVQRNDITSPVSVTLPCDLRVSLCVRGMFEDRCTAVNGVITFFPWIQIISTLTEHHVQFEYAFGD